MSAWWVEHSFAPHMHDFFAVTLNYSVRGAFDRQVSESSIEHAWKRFRQGSRSNTDTLRPLINSTTCRSEMLLDVTP
jgi:hypothetical protein